MFPSLYNPFSKRQKSSEEIVLQKNIECLVLLGDNIFDNFCGIEDPTKDVEFQIIDTLHIAEQLKNKGKSNQSPKHSPKSKLNSSDSKEDDDSPSTRHEHSDLLHIHNLSLHGLNLDGLLHGMAPDPDLIKLRSKCQLPKYPVDGAVDDDKMYPLELLSAMVAGSEIEVTAKPKDKYHVNPTVVLSIGLMDMIGNLKFGKPELIVETLRKQSFAANLEKAVRRIVEALGLNLIIVIPFEPHERLTQNKLHFARDDLLSVLDYVACKLMQIAAKVKCPVIDLSRTLNPFNAEHYGSSQLNDASILTHSTGMELSNESGQFLVDLMIKIFADLDWNDEEKKSQIYFGTKDDAGIQIVDNDKSCRSSYFNVLQTRAMLNEATIDANEMDLLADLFDEE